MNKAADPRAPEPARAAQPTRAQRDDPSDSRKQAPVVVALHGGVRLLRQALPVNTLAFSAGVELPLRAFMSVQLTGVASLRERPTLGPGEVRVQLLSAETLGCGHGDVAWLRMLGCVGVAGGALLARGAGYDDDLSATLGWLSGLLRVALRGSITSVFALQLSATGHLNIVRPELHVAGSDRVRISRPAGGSVGLDMIFAMR